MIKKILKKINIYFLTKFNKDIKLKGNVKISTKTLKKIQEKKLKILIKDSVIGSKVELGYGVKISDNVNCSGKIKLNNFVSLNGPGTSLSSELNGIEIGSFTSIAAGVVIQEHNHEYKRATSYYILNNLFKDENSIEIFSKGKIIIEEDVWIGSNSVVLSGVKIGRGSIIGAGSVVTKDIEPYSIALGNPAKVIKKRFNESTIRKLEESKWWLWDLEKIKQNKVFFKEIRE